jgi:RND superfamily putative drug exporter
MLLPASMKLLGEWNWWLPRKLHWLPRVSLEGTPAPAEA